MAILQHLPYLGTAEDDVLFVEWLVDEGSPVKPGTPLATVETLKAAFDVEAETEGVLLRRLVAAGQRMAIHAPIGVVGVAGEPLDDRILASLLGTGAEAPRVAVATAPTPAPAQIPPVVESPVAPAARKRALELRIDLNGLVGSGPDGLVRLADVEKAHSAAVAEASAPAGGRTVASDGTVDPEFLAAIQKDPAFGALSSDFKLQLYRRYGAQIGKDSRLGVGTVLRVGRLVLGERTFVGPDSMIEAKHFEAGPLLHLGARCRVRCTTIRCGENTFFADDVEIGGGGAMDPEAELVVGSHGFVGEHVHLNPCRTLRIGDEVVVSRGACVMTHSFGPSWLAGYPSRFQGVEVGDGAQIGIHATLFPGVQVGAGAVILSGSSVVTSVPPGRLFGGVPAVDMKAAAQLLTEAQVVERAQSLVAEFGRQLLLRGLPVVVTASGGHTVLTVARDDGLHRLDFAPRADFAATSGVAEQIQVAVEYPDAEFAAAPATAVTIGLQPPRVRGSLGPLGSAFREFLRKRGVRLHPRTWAYTGGWL